MKMEFGSKVFMNFQMAIYMRENFLDKKFRELAPYF